MIWLNVAAQAPQSFKYQAVARDLSGNVLAGKSVRFRISILKGSTSPTAVYTEQHIKTTNSFGLVELEIGKGSVPSGSFPGINWGNDDYFLKVEMDPNGGSAFQEMGTSQFLSVPYALYARETGSSGLTLPYSGSVNTYDYGINQAFIVENTYSNGIGVWGRSGWSGVLGTSDTGIGVRGQGPIALYGVSDVEKGEGLRVVCYDNSSQTIGVWATVASPIGYSGYFIGGRFFVSGNVGIGDGAHSPDYRLDVRAAGTSSTGIAVFRNSSGDNKVLIRQNSNGCGAVAVYNTGGESTIGLVGDGNSYINGGNLGIGTTSPNYKLDVRGTIGNNTTLYHSDRRWKTDFVPVRYGIQDLMKLNSISYLWNVADYPDMGFDKNVQFGFIAQEFEQVIPELVTTDNEGYKSIDYVKLTPLLVKAIQQQQEIIEGMKAENDRLKTENEQVISRIEKLEKLMGTSSMK
ncbi:MAG TPA: tail fiber domain-containing protein [Bacteroidales bacterium]|jgi:hypothetical protein|nr:tail fiber domain-containing protein [Bacteroidales bacterium]HQK70085.1 tail fiber domain-containing protein [Bacteroidales bacterium]